MSTSPPAHYLERSDLDALIAALAGRGYEVVGPTVAGGAVVYEPIASSADLPAGVGDEQDGGHYRLVERGDAALFGYNLGPGSWKPFLHAPRVRLQDVRREGERLVMETPADDPPRRALLGVRACELRAMAVQDRVLLGDRFVDPHYARRRAGVFVVAVNCGQAGGTCFCVSMDSGPRAQSGYDLALTELLDDGRHGFLVEAGSAAGAEVLAGLPARAADAAECAAADAAVARAAAAQGRHMETEGLPALLADNPEHPRWDDVAARCLTCANCTLVCPTCFCTTVEDVTDVTGDHAERWRRWDSCFTLDFTHLHGGSVRASARSRYRQWLTHKLSGWHEQFGESGCVGCGRCISWCPVGIDITAEVRALRDAPAQEPEP